MLTFEQVEEFKLYYYNLVKDYTSELKSIYPTFDIANIIDIEIFEKEEIINYFAIIVGTDFRFKIVIKEKFGDNIKYKYSQKHYLTDADIKIIVKYKNDFKNILSVSEEIFNDDQKLFKRIKYFYDGLLPIDEIISRIFQFMSNNLNIIPYLSHHLYENNIFYIFDYLELEEIYNYDTIGLNNSLKNKLFEIVKIVNTELKKYEMMCIFSYKNFGRLSNKEIIYFDIDGFFYDIFLDYTIHNYIQETQVFEYHVNDLNFQSANSIITKSPILQSIMDISRPDKAEKIIFAPSSLFSAF